MQKHRLIIQRRLWMATFILAILFAVGADNVLAQGISITSLHDINNSGGSYILANDVIISGDADMPQVTTFSGTLDGNGFTVTGLRKPLFETVTSNAKLTRLTFKDVQIDNSTLNYVGIVGSATGSARLFNIGIIPNNPAYTGDGESKIKSTKSGASVGSIVGYINNNARVLNCFSYANVEGNTSSGTAAGIVGNVASANCRVINCMYYGNVSGNTVSPVYGGQIITNSGPAGINNYNYYRVLAGSVITSGKYNCALGIEDDRYLTRFEFYRSILNSNKNICAFYAVDTINTTSALNKIMKWVVDTSIAPFPILKPRGRYPSVINKYIDASHSSANPILIPDNYSSVKFRGSKIADLAVTVMGGATNGATGTSVAITLPITDMDTANFDYGFRKVQLPYYRDVFLSNMTIEAGNLILYGSKVVTGWEITSVTGNTTNTFVANTETGYNFADTTDTGKDIYSTSKRVFAQGGYYYVPQGVTAITLKAHWANAVYVSDKYYDMNYTSGSNGAYTYATPTISNRPNSIARRTTFNEKTIYNSWTTAISASSTSGGIYDNAIVLVGNLHHYNGSSNNVTPVNNCKVTFMSADEDGDNEPDYCLIYQHEQRANVNPIRFDFLPVIGFGMAAKVTGSKSLPAVGIFFSYGDFEITETALIRFTEFEYEWSGKLLGSRLILNGGIFESFLSTQTSTNINKTDYIILGGNILMPAFANGKHGSDGQPTATKHNPISVMGGDFGTFHLSGDLRANANAISGDNAECYINGGHFHELAGAGQEQIDGNVTWVINHAIIQNFYGGGCNSDKPVTGNITTTINNSVVGTYCGGPKFGNMTAGKTVTTNATGTVFGQYFGAGNGGTCLKQVMAYNYWDGDNAAWAGSFSTCYTDFNTTRTKYWFDKTISTIAGGSKSNGTGIPVSYELRYFHVAGGNTYKMCGQFIVNFAKFDKAQTNSVISNLTNCIVNGNFYGGGNLGQTESTNSTLTDCHVLGNAFGGGYSATVPTVSIFTSTIPPTKPNYNEESSAITYPDIPPDAPKVATWKTHTTITSGDSAVDDPDNPTEIYTTDQVTGLGSVTGNTHLTINGTTIIEGSVFGGGDESSVGGETNVIISGTAQIHKDVFGGGNNADVNSHTHVTIGNTTGAVNEKTRVEGSVFGGGNIGTVGADDASQPANTNVLLQGRARINKNVYGGGNKGVVYGSTNVKIDVDND